MGIALHLDLRFYPQDRRFNVLFEINMYASGGERGNGLGCVHNEVQFSKRYWARYLQIGLILEYCNFLLWLLVCFKPVIKLKTGINNVPSAVLAIGLGE